MDSSSAWTMIQALRDGPALRTPEVPSAAMSLLSGGALIVVSRLLRYGRKAPQQEDS